MGFIGEFKEFLNEYKVLALAIAFVMGLAITDLVQSLVKNIIMAFVSPLLATGGNWQTATFTMGPFIIGWGAFLGALINFIIIAIIIFMIAKVAMKKQKVGNI